MNNNSKGTMIKLYGQMLLWQEQCKFFGLKEEDLPNFSYKGIPEDVANVINSAKEKEIILDDEILSFKATKSQIKVMTQKVFNKVFLGDSKNDVLFNKLWSKVVVNPKIECPVEGITCGKTNLEMNLKGKRKIGIRNIEINRLDTYYAVISLMHEFAHALFWIFGKKICTHKHVLLTEYFSIVCEKIAAIIVAEELQDERFYIICDNFRTNEIIKYEKFLRDSTKERERFLKKLEANKYSSEIDMTKEYFKHEIIRYQNLTWLGYIVSEFYALETVRLFQEDSDKVRNLFTKLKNDQLKVEDIIETLKIDIYSDLTGKRFIEKFKEYS